MACLAAATVLPIGLIAALGAGLVLAARLATAISLVAGLVAGTLADIRHRKSLVLQFRLEFRNSGIWNSEFSYNLRSESELLKSEL